MGLTAEDEEALELIRKVCLAFPHAQEAELQGRPLFRVRRRRFAIFNGEGSPARPRWNGCGRSLHFLSSTAERNALQQDRRFTPSPHHGDRGWLSMRIDARSDWPEVGELLDAAYRQAAPSHFTS